MFRVILKPFFVVVFALPMMATAVQADFVSSGTTSSFQGGSVNSVSVVGAGTAFSGSAANNAPIASASLLNLDITIRDPASGFGSLLTIVRDGLGTSEYLMQITVHNASAAPLTGFTLDLASPSFGTNADFSTAFYNAEVGSSTDAINNNPGVFDWVSSPSGNPASNHLMYGKTGGSQLPISGVTTVNAFLFISKGTSNGGIGSINLSFNGLVRFPFAGGAMVTNPEPGTLLLAGLALSGFSCRQRRRGQKTVVALPG